MKKCQEISELASLSLEQKISLVQKTELKLHLLVCRHCRIFHKNNQILSNILKDYQNKDDIPKNIKP